TQNDCKKNSLIMGRIYTFRGVKLYYNNQGLTPDLFIINSFFLFGLTYVVDMTNIVTYNRIMINLNINEIKTHFSSYLAKVSNGETVIVCKRNVPIAEIKPIAALPNKKRPIGLAGKEYPEFQISDAFFEPLPDDIVAAFNGEDS
ncbi:MAG: type II toxin-antitoxin system Phd/YefM family antitoxin, partial [Deltaproteobacteria bacterium]|nr:type II toxin-antitoxin system Phd/YefM family antitoxin [Deltaproteobacteria bacterium]